MTTKEIIERCRALASKLGRGNPKLAAVANAYAMFYVCPGDMAAKALVECRLEELEAEEAGTK